MLFCLVSLFSFGWGFPFQFGFDLGRRLQGQKTTDVREVSGIGIHDVISTNIKKKKKINFMDINDILAVWT